MFSTPLACLTKFDMLSFVTKFRLEEIPPPVIPWFVPGSQCSRYDKRFILFQILVTKFVKRQTTVLSSLAFFYFNLFSVFLSARHLLSSLLNLMFPIFKPFSSHFVFSLRPSFRSYIIKIVTRLSLMQTTHNTFSMEPGQRVAHLIAVTIAQLIDATNQPKSNLGPLNNSGVTLLLL